MYHKYIHALTASKLTFSHCERLYETKGFGEISKVAGQDLAKTIAEVGVLRKQDKYSVVPEECKKILKEEVGDLL